LHQRDRHRDLRRLSLRALPQPAAHRDPIRAANRARRGRAHLSLLGRRFRRGGVRLGVVLRDLRARRNPEPVAARLAAATWTFRGAWDYKRSTLTPLIAAATPSPQSPPARRPCPSARSRRRRSAQAPPAAR